MAIFNSYVSLPEGTPTYPNSWMVDENPTFEWMIWGYPMTMETSI